MKDRKKSKSILKGASFFLATFAFVGLFAMGTRFIKHKDYDVYNQEMVAMADTTASISYKYKDGTVQDFNGSWFRSTYLNSHTYGEESILPTTKEIHRSGYVFDGWYTDEDCTAGHEISVLGAAYQGPGDTQPGTLTFYAKWVAATQRTVTKGAETNGIFDVSVASAYVGDEISVTSITPDPGYAVKSIYYTDTGDSQGGITQVVGDTFYAPDFDITVCVEFDLLRSVTKESPLTNGDLSFSSSSAVTGTTITVTAAPDSHYEVETIYYYTSDPEDPTALEFGENDNEWKFVLPEENVTVGATFKAVDYQIIYKDEGDVAFSGVHGTGYPTTHTYFAAENLVNPTKAGYRFLGWFTDSACTAGNEITAVPAGQEDYTVYAKWGVTYAVTADPGVTNGTLSVDISQALAGEEVTVTANANTGYALTALYYIEAGDVGNTHHDINQTTKKFNAPAVAVTVYAEYTIQSYTITFNSDGGSEVAAITQNYGTAVTAPTDPTKEGYTFAGWSSAVPPTMPAENITLTAQWNENYTITIVGLLVSDTYTGTIPETYHVGSADITLPADVTRTGYTFNGWTWEGQSTPTTTAVITTGSTGNKTFTANFTAQTYVITYKDQGNVAYSGSNEALLPTPHTYNTTTTLVDGVKTGYRFLGWYDNQACTGDPVTSIGATEITAPITLYAKWAELYTVSVASGITHGTVSAVVEAIEGEVVTVTVTPDAGYQLATLWFSAATTPDATAENINQTTKQFTMLAGNTEITATFTAIQYTITCINDGDSSNQYFTVETDTFNLVNPTKTGYTFTGWSGTGLTGEDNMTVTIAQGSTVDRTYTAHYSKDTYEITYTLHDGSVASANPANYQVDTAEFTLTNPTKTGYTFTGWSGTDLTGNDNMTVTVTEGSTGNRTYEAHFTPITYTITKIVDVYNVEETYTIESETHNITNPVLEGYDFTGWTGDNGDTPELNVEIAQGSTGDRTYTAHFTAQVYYITYKDQGNVAYTGTNPGSLVATHTYDTTTNLVAGVKAGYRFMGWHKLADCSDVAVASIGETDYTADFTLYAEWAELYTVSDSATTNGSFTRSVSEQIAGESVVVNVSPDSHYALNELYYVEAGSSTHNAIYMNGDDEYEFTMPAANVTIYATFAAIQYNITNNVNPSVDNGALSFSPSSAPYGATITVTITPNTGYEVTGLWYYTDDPEQYTLIAYNANTGTFNMPGDVVVCASFQAKTFTVLYEKQGGGDLESDVVMPDGYPTTHTYGTTTILPVPTRDGYRFMGWYNDAPCTGAVFTEIGATAVTSGSPKFYAKWAELYSISTNVNVATYAIVTVTDTLSQNIDEAIETENVTATVDIDTRYQLKNNGLYYIEANDANETHHAITSGIAFAMPADDITIYVEIEKVPYAISTVVDVSADSQVHGTISAQATAGWNDEVVLSFTPDANYEINPTSLYYTVASDSHTNHFAIGQYENNVFKFNMPDEAVTIHGSFKLIDYTITDAGTTNGYIRFMLGNDVISTATVGTTVTVEINPGTGYKLAELKYTTDPTADEPTYTTITTADVVSATFVMPGANITVVATFTGRTYTVTFDPAGGTMPVEQFPTAPYEQEVVYDQNYGVLPTPTRTGYNFAGWYFTYEDPQTQEEQDILIEDNEEYSVPADITITAHWTAQQYTISYKDENDVNYSGTNLASLPTTHTYGTATPLVAGVKTGYNFLGWYDNVICTGEAVETIAADAITANQIYYAKWEAQVYTITYMDKNDGENPVPFSGVHEQGYPESHTYNTTTILDTPTKTGYSFQGWYDNANCTGSPVTTIGPTDTLTALTFYALWEINSYTITFNSNGGSAVASITQDYGTAITAPADPTREGYTFDGWDADVPTTMPAEDVTLTAQWHINQYTITFDTAGGSAIAAITQDYNTSVTAPADPTREGYTFGGWDRLIPTTMPAENITITAQWGVNSYTLTFDSNGGSAVASITQDYGTEVNAPADPTRTGYTFTGWSPAVPATMPAVNQTLVAQWSVKSYKIVYKDQGNEDFSGIHGNGYPIQYVYDQLTNLVNPTKDGYTFKGWFTDPDCVYVITKIPASSRTGDLTVYAKWAPNNYNIILIVDGDYFRQYPYNVTTDTFLVANPTKTGYDFIGWTDGNIVPTDELYIEQGSSGNQIYTAVFEAKTYDISYVNYDGETAVGSLTAQYTYDQTTPLAPATKTGYDFVGWDLNGQTINQIAKESVYGDIQLEPVWQAKQYPITYKDQGNATFTGTFTTQYPLTYTFEQEEPLTNPTRTGYDFVGWYTDSACTDGNEIEVIPDDQATGGITVYAKWTAQEYTITYKDQNDQNYSGSNEESLPDTHTYNVATVLVAGVRSGYTFGGWYTDSACTAQVAQIGANTRTADFTLYAKWINNSYDIVYRDQGDVDFTGSRDGLLTKYTHDIYNNLVDATRPGYDFQGWYKDQDCLTSRVYSLQNEIGEVTLYAKWTNHVFTVGLNTAYGDTGLYGTLDSDNYTTEVTYLGQYGELETPHLDHYDFLGWYSDFRFDNKVESTTIYTFTNNTILYAKWAPTTYTLTLNIDGRTEYVAFDVEDEAFTVENPTKTGYTFTGWTRVDNDHDDDYGMNYAPLTHLENHTLTARFEVTPYTYTLVPSDEIIEKLGQATFNDMEVFSGYNYNYITEEITLPNVDLEEYGYTFIGWTGEGTEEATIGLTIPFHSTGDRTYTAHFTGKTYTLSFDTNGGEVDDPSKEVQYEEGYGELPVPTRENYTFVGWFDDEGNEVTAETIMSVKEGISIHARWATVTYRIKKVIDTGIAVIQLYNVESNKITLQAPTKRGYKFIGWTGTGLEEITKNVVIPTGSSGDKTFIAHFELATYTITTKVKNEIREIEYTLESEDITLPDVNIPGYAFKGWIGEDVLTPTKELVIPTGSIGNRVYTASLRALTYFITLTNDSENTRIRYTADDEDFELPTLEKEGYVFAGWLADGETEPVKNLVIPSGTTGDKHYTAVWTEYEEPAPSEEKKNNKALTIGLASAAGVAVAGGILAGAFTFVKKKKKF